MIVLRDYQEKMIADIYSSLRAHRSVMAVMSTGLGKTVVAARIMSDWLAAKLAKKEMGKRLLFIVASNVLIDQTVDKLIADGVDTKSIGVIGGGHMRRFARPVQVCTIQTLKLNPIYLEMLDIDFCIWDECDTCAWHEYSQRLLDLDCFHLGLTATPERGKRSESMGQKFKSCVIGPPMATAIELGNLCPFKIRIIDSPDRGLLKTVEGEFTDKSVGLLMDNPISINTALDGLTSNWSEFFGEPKATLVFCTSVKHAQNVMAAAIARGIPTEIVVGSTSAHDRKQIQRRLESGETQVVVSVAALSIGFDCPAIRVLLDLRPTASRRMHVQKWGRGARLFDGKAWCLVLDAAGNWAVHDDPVETIYTVAEALNGRERKTVLCPACGKSLVRVRGCSLVDQEEYWFCSACYNMMSKGAERQAAAGKDKPLLTGIFRDINGNDISKAKLTETYRLIAKRVYQAKDKPGKIYYEFKKQFPETGGKPPRGSKRGACIGPSPTRAELQEFVDWVTTHLQDPEKREWQIKGETGLGYWDLLQELRNVG